MTRFYKDRFDEDRKRQRDFESDCYYEAWRSGVNPDRLDYDRMSDACREGREPEGVVRDIQRRDQMRRERREYEEMAQAEDEYYRELDMRDNEREAPSK